MKKLSKEKNRKSLNIKFWLPVKTDSEILRLSVKTQVNLTFSYHLPNYNPTWQKKNIWDPFIKPKQSSEAYKPLQNSIGGSEDISLITHTIMEFNTSRFLLSQTAP